MLKSVLERLDAGRPINSVATYATRFKSVFQLILWLFFCLWLLWQGTKATLVGKSCERAVRNECPCYLFVLN